jgi:hypothetical protein
MVERGGMCGGFHVPMPTMSPDTCCARRAAGIIRRYIKIKLALVIPGTGYGHSFFG